MSPSPPPPPPPTPFATPPPRSADLALSVPAPHVLLVTICRARRMNSIPRATHWEGDALWSWFDDEPSLRVAVLTGEGTVAFSAGADLKEISSRQSSADGEDGGGRDAPLASMAQLMPPSGFLGLSRRLGKKPVVAAVNGYAYGGGFELALNCDLVVASPTARFGLPEASRGLYAAAGGLARAVRLFGLQLASDVALAGRVLSADELRQLGFCRVAASPAALLPEALQLAAAVAAQSPDAVLVSRAGLRQAWETASVERAAQLVDDRYARALLAGENLRIGTAAFVQKKAPVWVPSKL